MINYIENFFYTTNLLVVTVFSVFQSSRKSNSILGQDINKKKINSAIEYLEQNKDATSKEVELSSGEKIHVVMK